MTIATSTAVIRQWARAQGLTVGDRGRLSPQLLDAYATSHDQINQSADSAATTATQVSHKAGLRIGVRPAPGATGNMRTISARAAESAAFR
jgi:hypothetical protein